MYLSDLILSHHSINYHFYADDTQLYKSSDLSDSSITHDRITNCVSDLRTWMIQYELRSIITKQSF